MNASEEKDKADLLKQIEKLENELKSLKNNSSFNDLAINSNESFSYRYLFENSPIPTLIEEFSENKLTILDANEAALKLYGWTRDEFRNIELHELIPEESIDAYKELNLLLQTQSYASTEALAIDKFKHKFPIKLHVNAFKDENRMVAIVTIEDKTKEKEAITNLIENENKYHSLFDAEPSGIFMIDVNTKRVLDANKAACELYGYSKPEILQLTADQLSAEPQFTLDFIEAGKLNDLAKVPYRKHKHKNGTEFPVEISASFFEINGKLNLCATISNISERLRIENERKVYQERFEVIFSALNDAVFLHPLQEEGFSSFEEVNQTACDRYGYSKEEFLQLTAVDITINQDAESHSTTKHRKSLLDSEQLIFETTHIKKGGEQFPVEINSNIIYKDEKPYIISVVRDISKRKEVEKLLSDKELHFQTMADAGQTLIWTTDTKLNCNYINKPWLNFTGKTSEELLGQKWFSDIHHNDIQNFKQALEINFRKQSSYTSEFRLKKKNGEFRWMQNYATPFYNSSKNFMGFLGHCVDVTEEKKLLESIRKNEEKLTEAQKVAKLGYYEFDILKSTWTCSAEMDSLFGIDAHAEKTVESWLGLIHPSDQLMMQHYLLNDVLQQGKNFDKEYRIINQQSKKLIWVRGLGKLIFDANNKAVKMFGTIQDINDRKKFESEITQAKERAEESDKLKTAFLANMSHEIRTPMNGILGFANLLKNQNLDEEKRDTYIEIIEKSGLRMQSIINDLIDISKIEAGQIEIQLEESSVIDLLTDAYHFFKPEIEQKGLEFNLNVQDGFENIKLNIDKNRIAQVLSNLIKNAIKFTKEGEISLSCSHTASEIQISVKDTGIGIPTHLQAVIFERFRQADSSFSKQYDGAGLGLSISSALIEIHEGRLDVNSELGKGSEFHFNLPLQKSSNEDVKSISLPKEIAQQNELQRKILIAEDDEINYQYLNEILGKNNITCIRANNGAEAIQKLYTNQGINLILMDIKMPVMDGIEATKRIKRMQANIPIIAQTAFANQADLDKAMQAGCDDYISKPIDKDVLYVLIRKYFSI